MDPVPAVASPSPPWLEPELFPEKPANSPYGYLERGKLVECSREELIERCGGTNLPLISVAWAPEVERLATVQEIPFLLDPLRTRTRKSIRMNLWIAALAFVFWSINFIGTSSQHREYVWLMLLSFAILPLAQGIWGLRKLRHLKPEDPGEIMSARYAAWIASQSRCITIALLVVLATVYGAQLFAGMDRSVQLGALLKANVTLADAYRFLTAPLMHGGVFHIGMNGLVLLGLGAIVEAMAGGAALALIFGFSCLTGSALSFLLSPQASVGASGGIMGLIGCLAVMSFRFRALLPPMFARQMLLNLLLIGFIGYMSRHIIDNAAHAGGLVGGAAIGWMLLRAQTALPLRLSATWRALGYSALVLVMIAAVYLLVLFFR